MLRGLLLSGQLALLALAGYHILIGLWGWPHPRETAAGARSRRVTVAVPAHDEERVIEGVLSDLREQDYPGDCEVWVIADRCSDATVELASALANVAERAVGVPGKGPALDWFLGRHPVAVDGLLVVLDADNRVSSSFISEIVDRIDSGEDVVQAYLDATNPDRSVVSLAGALTYWAGNRMVQQARERLGWSTDLGGTGMAFTGEALTDLAGFGGSLTEDQEIGARLVVAGRRTAWMHNLRVRDEKPTQVAAAARQRARWMAGKRAVRREWLFPLVKAGLRSRSWGPIDAALRLIQPGRSFLALVTGVLWMVSVMVPSSLLLTPSVLGPATLVQVLAPVPFLLRDRVPSKYVIRYPLVVIIAALWIPVRIMSRFASGWYHTPHGE